MTTPQEIAAIVEANGEPIALPLIASLCDAAWHKLGVVL